MGPSKPDMWECLKCDRTTHIPGSYEQYLKQEAEKKT